MGGLRSWRHFDYTLVAVAMLLTAFGVVMIHSATLGSPDARLQGLWRRQAIFGVAGAGLVFLLAAFPRDYQWLSDSSWLAYLLAVVLLILVLFFGESEIGDVSGWFDLGFVRFQPSFLAMNLIAIAVGAILSRRRRRASSAPPLFGAPKTSLVGAPSERPGLSGYLVSGVMTCVLAGLVFLQPDLATAAVFVAMWLVMLFESTVEMRYVMLTAVVGLALLYPLWKLVGLLEFGYMHDRMLGFFNPGSDPNVRYQLKQAAIAIGSGGLWGEGLGQGTQSQLRYLPVRHTDFIFAVTAEELGFAGVMLLFALYVALFLRLLRIILIAPDTFGRLLVTGTLTMVLFQAVVNIGMNLGLLPVAGLPLPLVSYGPAALLTTMIGIGMAENVAMHRRKLEF